MYQKNIDRNPLLRWVSFSAAQEKFQKPKIFVEGKFLKTLVMTLLLSSVVGCASAEETPPKCKTPQGTIACPE